MNKSIAAGWVAAAMTAGAVLAGPPTITQQVTPGTISYQGQVQAAGGSNYTDGVYGIEFRLYDAATAGELLWGARYQPYLKNGFFNVILGQTGVGETALSGATYPAVGDFWKAIWLDPNLASKTRFLSLTIVTKLGVNVPDPHESFPRQQLLASPYAIQSQFAQQADSASRSLDDFAVPGSLQVAGTAIVSRLSAGTTTVGALTAAATAVTTLTASSNVTANLFAGKGTIPLGGIIMWSGTTAPAGWGLCDGTTQNGQTTPDLRGRFVLGYGTPTNLTARAINTTGGEEAHKLTIDEIPSHTHGLRLGYSAEADTDNEINVTRYDIAAGNGTSSATGGGLAHGNMPPFYVLAYIMRVQ